jgi:1-acyl-sn-glycerol-3-phosphate acyltransferase
MRSLLNYWWRIFAKVLSFTLFGVGALLLAFLVFPAIRLSIHPHRRLQRAMRRTVSGAFSLFVTIMTFLGLIEIHMRDPERLRAAKGVIVVANHPSLIDVVILIAYLPQADCITKSALHRNPFVRGVVRPIYIPNSLSFQETVSACADSIAEGNSLVIFPEGTRTSSDGLPRLKRGSAQLAVRVGCDILPVVINASNPRGLRKGDPFLSLSREGPLVFDIAPLGRISMEAYREQEPGISARVLTRELETLIVPQNHTTPLGA